MDETFAFSVDKRAISVVQYPADGALGRHTFVAAVDD
jgi:hypothetical protein